MIGQYHTIDRWVRERTDCLAIGHRDLAVGHDDLSLRHGDLAVGHE